jgi:hypothetical protein
MVVARSSRLSRIKPASAAWTVMAGSSRLLGVVVAAVSMI